MNFLPDDTNQSTNNILISSPISFILGQPELEHVFVSIPKPETAPKIELEPLEQETTPEPQLSDEIFEEVGDTNQDFEEEVPKDMQRVVGPLNF